MVNTCHHGPDAASIPVLLKLVFNGDATEEMAELMVGIVCFIPLSRPVIPTLNCATLVCTYSCNDSGVKVLARIQEKHFLGSVCNGDAGPMISIYMTKCNEDVFFAKFPNSDLKIYS